MHTIYPPFLFSKWLFLRNNGNEMKKLVIFGLLLSLFASCKESDKENLEWKWDEDKPVSIPVSQRSRIVWIDASANFKYFANSKENIALYLGKAKDAGFTEVVVDVRPTCGDVLYKSSIVNEAKKLGDVTRTEEWDYLAQFIEQGHKLGLKVYASMNTFVGGNVGNGGVVYRDAGKAAWLTQMYYPKSSETISILNDGRSDAKFFNPVNADAQSYVLSIVSEIATKYSSLDGIILDRARFNSIESDFSEYTRSKFESYAGVKLTKFPEQIFSYDDKDKIVPGTYYKKWLEFRAKVIYDFFEKARAAVKSANKNMKFGTYTGSWYSLYYNEGVNWASKRFNTAGKYSTWATPEYKNYGYAALLDIYMTGAYSEKILGATSEWTVEGAIINAKKVTMGDVPVCGSLYGLNFYGKPQDAEDATFVALTTGDGLMFFDIVYLIKYDQWNSIKRGIDRALATEKK